MPIYLRNAATVDERRRGGRPRPPVRRAAQGGGPYRIIRPRATRSDEGIAPYGMEEIYTFRATTQGRPYGQSGSKCEIRPPLADGGRMKSAPTIRAITEQTAPIRRWGPPRLSVYAYTDVRRNEGFIPSLRKSARAVNYSRNTAFTTRLLSNARTALNWPA